jgi:hypothetical protein
MQDKNVSAGEIKKRCKSLAYGIAGEVLLGRDSAPVNLTANV